MPATKEWNAVVEKATPNHVSFFIPPAFHWGAWTEEDLPPLRDGDTIQVRTTADGDQTIGFTIKGVFYEAVDR